MATVLITGGRAPVALEMVRLFSSAGHQVLVADSIAWPLAGASRHVTKTFKLLAPRFEPEAFASEIRAIARQYQVDLVIPTCEEVFYLGHFKKLIDAVCPVFCPDMPVLETLHDKFAFASSVNRHDGFGSAVRAPESCLLKDISQVDELPFALNELVLKPTFSRFAVSTLVRPTKADVALSDITPTNPWVAQRYVSGREFCSYAICRDGEIVAHAAYQSNWRAGKGASYYFDPIPAPDAFEFARGIAAHFNITGQIAFDFIRDDSGRLWVLECNPRATSGLHLLTAVPGVADAILGQGMVDPSTTTPKMLGLAMFLMGLPDAVRRHRTSQWVEDFRRGGDVLWRATDPLPFLAAVMNSAKFALKAIRSGITAEAETTRDIEWNGGEIPPYVPQEAA